MAVAGVLLWAAVAVPRWVAVVWVVAVWVAVVWVVAVWLAVV